MKKHSRRELLSNAAYILPNSITTGNLLFGFLSIYNSINGDFYLAALCILVASIFDILDGTVARLVNATSEFGVQYDSLCDLISFGAAPAFLLYLSEFQALGKVGLIIPFIYVCCGALRLARFNVLSAAGEAGGDFSGLPIPMAAIYVATFILARVAMGNEFETLLGGESNIISFALASGAFLSFLMVSNVGFGSHKSFDVKALRFALVFIVLALALVGFMNYPEATGFLLIFTYTLSGPLRSLLFRLRTEDSSVAFENSDASI